MQTRPLFAHGCYNEQHLVAHLRPPSPVACHTLALGNSALGTRAHSTQVYLTCSAALDATPALRAARSAASRRLGPASAERRFGRRRSFWRLGCERVGRLRLALRCLRGVVMSLPRYLATSLAWGRPFACACSRIIHAPCMQAQDALPSASFKSVTAPECLQGAARLCVRTVVQGSPCACNYIRECERRHGTGLKKMTRPGRRGCDMRQAAYSTFLHAVSRAVVNLTTSLETDMGMWGWRWLGGPARPHARRPPRAHVDQERGRGQAGDEAHDAAGQDALHRCKAQAGAICTRGLSPLPHPWSHAWGLTGQWCAVR